MNSTFILDNITNILTYCFQVLQHNPIIYLGIGIIFLFFSLLVIAIITYIIFKITEISIESTNIFFYAYNKQCLIMLDKYGNCPIKNIYLIRQPFGKLINFGLNIITLYQYDKLVNSSEDCFPYHPAFIFEIIYQNQIKLLLVEKNNCIHITDNFMIHQQDEMIPLKIKSNNILNTLDSILDKTRSRIGDMKFFNWNLFENNCQSFTKEILITLHKYTNKYKQFVKKDKIIKLYKPSDFALHLFHFSVIILNFIEKYLSI